MYYVLCIYIFKHARGYFLHSIARAKIMRAAYKTDHDRRIMRSNSSSSSTTALMPL